jgi:hypothetical protein
MFLFGHGILEFRAMVEVGLASIRALRPPRASPLSYCGATISASWLPASWRTS